MYFLYSFLLSIGFLLMLPLFLVRREKYAAGFSQRLGSYPEFKHDGRSVIWLHCVSVGETNAARPLADALEKRFSGYRLVVSTTTRTGQVLAKEAFADQAAAVFYFPFDWKFSVKKALDTFKPSVVLLMETEIWPRFIHGAKSSGAKIAIVNGRLSERSAKRYSMIRPFIRKVLAEIDLALMQGRNDAQRISTLGLDDRRICVTGNLKFDLALNDADQAIAADIDQRFHLSGDRPLIVAASTHDPEERWMIDAFCSAAAGVKGPRPKLLIAPRHPERFNAVTDLVEKFRTDPACEWPRYSIARRSSSTSPSDADADIIILDSIGELRAIYPLAEIVFVGGSLIPHGGQSILEPAAAGKAIITGHYTHNFDDVVRTFAGSGALVRLPDKTGEQIVDELFLAISDLLENADERRDLGLNAAAVMKANRGATARTIEELAKLIQPR